MEENLSFSVQQTNSFVAQMVSQCPSLSFSSPSPLFLIAVCSYFTLAHRCVAVGWVQRERVSSLHAAGFVHRDIRLANFVIGTASLTLTHSPTRLYLLLLS